MPTVRILKIAAVLVDHFDKRSRRSHEQRTAALRLQGLWLEQAGFTPGQVVQVEVGPGRLIITHPLAPAAPRGLAPTEIQKQIDDSTRAFNEAQAAYVLHLAEAEEPIH